MANHLSLVNGDLIDNDCYSFLIDQWVTHGIDSWNITDLIYEFGPVSVDEILKENYLVHNFDGNVKLAFRVLGTVCNLIVTMVSDKIYTKDLLQQAFKSFDCSSNKLKSYLIFLENFNQIYHVDLAATGRTCIAAEGSESLVADFDWFASLSDYFDQKCIHSMDTEIGCQSIQFLKRA